MGVARIFGSMSLFADRHHAGKVLARKLARYAGTKDLLVLGLPRGGVPVAYEVAQALGGTLDTFIVRKLGVPHHEELAMGAIASGGAMVLDERLIDELRVTPEELDAVISREKRELARREREYRADLPPLDVAKKVVILIDDGLATGATMRAALAALRNLGAARLVVAVPLSPPDTCDVVAREADEVICALTPEPFYGVGKWYRDFSQTTDEEVHALLARARLPSVALAHRA